MKNEVWDYNGWVKFTEITGSYTQNDWNQTLVTMLNQLTKDYLLPILIKIPKRLKPLINSLVFYKNGKIGDYFVRFYDLDNYIIELPNQIKLEIINYNKWEKQL